MENRKVLFKYPNTKLFERRGVFLGFGVNYSENGYQYTCAIIEDEEGEVSLIDVENILFIKPLLSKEA